MMWPGSKHSFSALARSSASWPKGSKSNAARSPWQMHRLMLTVLLLALLMSGCAGSVPVAPRPPRPTLESLMPTNDGGICMDRGDAAELLLYLDALERR